ncbi:hypothetical protein EZV62_001163 [Acer yangbiense]|uniref:Uncharacterized protein n=1 Tax=Acer yangbiense TaxID=1000413 RepID=A0A5C7IUQ2_9ROSI|nr:hypothetical protein EZV62_001163 [Acer yangbiense]
MFRSSEMVRDLTWHSTYTSQDGKMRHPVDSPAWETIDDTWQCFASDPRNLRLGLAADGFNPFRNLSSTHSTWPVVLVTYNLPPWKCMSKENLMLTLLIPGPKQPGNDIDVYLQPLIEDLIKLWDVGAEVYDVSINSTFTLKTVLMWTINDFPAYGNLAGCCVKELQHLDSNLASRSTSLQRKHTSTFSTWFKAKVIDESSSLDISSTLKWLAFGPMQQVTSYTSYVVNGKRYRTIDSEKCTQDSGVSLEAEMICTNNAKDDTQVIKKMVYYGILREILLLDFYKFCVPLFKCDWEISQRYTELARKNETPQTTSWKGLAQLREELREAKLANNEDPNEVDRMETWIAAHKHKNGTPVNENVGEMIEKMEEIAKDGPKTIANDAVPQVIGKEHLGRVRGLGFGVTPTKVQASMIGKKTTMQLQEDMNNLKQQFIELQTQLVNIQSTVRGATVEASQAHSSKMNHQQQYSSASNQEGNSNKVKIVESTSKVTVDATAAKYHPSVLVRAISGVRQHHIKIHACNTATSVAKNACVFLQALLEIKKSVHAITTGRPKKEHLSVHEHSKQHLCFKDKIMYH